MMNSYIIRGKTKLTLELVDKRCDHPVVIIAESPNAAVNAAAYLVDNNKARWVLTSGQLSKAAPGDGAFMWLQIPDDEADRVGGVTYITAGEPWSDLEPVDLSSLCEHCGALMTNNECSACAHCRS